MTPIEKNISVVDEQGNIYEATYPKRAKGLVKKGRARFVSENRICLACPPKKISEDEEMADNAVNTQITEENTDKKIVDTKVRYSIEYALEQIEKISASTAYLDNVISELRQMETPDGVGDIANQAKAQALADVVRCRETTNQKLLEFYFKMVDDLKPKNYTE